MSVRRAAVAAFALLAPLGCAGEPRRAPSATGAAAGAADAGTDAAVGQVPLPSLDELAAAAQHDVAGMREVARLEHAEARSASLVADAGAGTCVRVRFAASRTVDVALTDRDGRSRGDGAHGTGGLVPPLGPACVAGKDELQLVVKGAPGGTQVRAVVLAAP